MQLAVHKTGQCRQWRIGEINSQRRVTGADMIIILTMKLVPTATITDFNIDLRDAALPRGGNFNKKDTPPEGRIYGFGRVEKRKA
jgi:hypothetical protein